MYCTTLPEWDQQDEIENKPYFCFQHLLLGFSEYTSSCPEYALLSCEKNNMLGKEPTSWNWGRQIHLNFLHSPSIRFLVSLCLAILCMPKRNNLPERDRQTEIENIVFIPTVWLKYFQSIRLALLSVYVYIALFCVLGKYICRKEVGQHIDIESTNLLSFNHIVG